LRTPTQYCTGCSLKTRVILPPPFAEVKVLPAGVRI
jgi:hypothetical protein